MSIFALFICIKKIGSLTVDFENHQNFVFAKLIDQNNEEAVTSTLKIMTSNNNVSPPTKPDIADALPRLTENHWPSKIKTGKTWVSVGGRKDPHLN